MERKYVVDGFEFNSVTDAELAKNELNGVEYLKERTDFKNAKNVLSVYNTVVDKQLFKTPVGYKFLKDLQEILYKSVEIDNDDIVAIPVFSEKGKEKSKEKKSKKTKSFILSKEDEKYKNRFTNSVIINILLVILLVLFIIISSNSNNANIINYENRINREYTEKENHLAKWQQELTIKEQQLRDLE